MAMILYMLNKDMPMKNDPLETHVQYYSGIIGAMALGMMAGAVTFNVLSSVSSITYRFFTNRSQEEIMELASRNQPTSEGNDSETEQQRLLQAVRS